MTEYEDRYDEKLKVRGTYLRRSIKTSENVPRTRWTSGILGKE